MVAPAVSIRTRRRPDRGTWRKRPLGVGHRPARSNRPRVPLYLVWYVPCIALATYAVAMWCGTHLSPSRLKRLPRFPWAGADKICHFCAYAGLMLLVMWALLATGRLRRWSDGTRDAQWWILAACAILALCGVIDELTQPLVGRNCDWRDWVANVAGIATAVLLCHAAWWFKRRGAIASV